MEIRESITNGSEFLEKEKLPIELGWERSKVLLNDGDLSYFLDLIQNITETLGEDVAVPEDGEGYVGKLKPRGGFHAGM